MRCLALFSGGLDSQLAVRLIQRQGVEVLGLHVAAPMCSSVAAAAAATAANLGIELRTMDLSEAFCQLVRNPRFGRITGAAPCLDCRIAVFAQAPAIMAQCDAQFAISGEVVGQRPRTAVRDLEIVSHHAGLSELLVRPLSAGLLPATLPELRGWIDRTRLLAIQGKGRKTQHQLAAELRLSSIPQPRPECPLLAEPLAGRVLEMLADRPAISPWDLALAAIGRHFRLGDRARVVVSRNRDEGDELAELAAQSCDATLLEPIEFAGPTVLLVGEVDQHAPSQALQYMANHSKRASGLIRANATRGGQPLGVWELAIASEEAQ